jgi:hypothetical protein
MSWTTLLVDDNNPIKNLFINNLDANDIDCQEINGKTTNNLVTDSTGTLSINNIVIGNGTRDLKDSGISISTPSFTSVTTPLINSTGSLTLNSASNQNIIIDAQGTGTVRFPTITQGGVSFDASDMGVNWISTVWTGNGSTERLVAGIYDNGIGDQRPVIGGHNSSFSSWRPLWLNGLGTEPVIVGNTTRTASLVHGNMLYCVGNFESTGIIRGSSIRGTDITSTTNIVLKQSSSLVNVSVVYPSSLSNVLVPLPPSTSRVRKIRLIVSMFDFVTSGGGCVFNLQSESGSQIVGTIIQTDGIWQVLEFANNNIHNSTNYLQISQLWQPGVSAGTIILNSFIVELY